MAEHRENREVTNGGIGESELSGEAEGNGEAGRNIRDTSAGVVGESPKRKRKKADVVGLPILETEPEEVKPEKKKSKRQQKSESSEILLKSLLSAVSTIAGSRNPLWIMQDAEISSIAEPGGRLIAKHLGDKSEEWADGIGLVFAVGMVFGSRIVISMGGKKNAVRKTNTIQPNVEQTDERTPSYGAGLDSSHIATALS